jgi:hypothetical protein
MEILDEYELMEAIDEVQAHVRSGELTSSFNAWIERVRRFTANTEDSMVD